LTPGDDGSLSFAIFINFDLYTEIGGRLGRYGWGRFQFAAKICAGGVTDSIGEYRFRMGTYGKLIEEGDQIKSIDPAGFHIPLLFTITNGFGLPHMNWIADPAEQQEIIQEIARAVFHVSSVNTFPTLDVPVDLSDRLRRFTTASSGFTSDTPLRDNLLRMVCLSVATATTLGYGDIVPVTAMARNCIMLEALLGVTLAGFFVSAGFRRTYKERGVRPSSEKARFCFSTATSMSTPICVFLELCPTEWSEHLRPARPMACVDILLLHVARGA
jgi:hypothetical protein